MNGTDWIRVINAGISAVDAVAIFVIWWFIPRTYTELTRQQKLVFAFRRTTLFGAFLLCVSGAYGNLESMHQHAAYGFRIWLFTFASAWLAAGAVPWAYFASRYKKVPK